LFALDGWNFVQRRIQDLRKRRNVFAQAAAPELSVDVTMPAISGRVNVESKRFSIGDLIVEIPVQCFKSTDFS
jgi:hypothetical protein